MYVCMYVYVSVYVYVPVYVYRTFLFMFKALLISVGIATCNTYLCVGTATGPGNDHSPVRPLVNDHLLRDKAHTDRSDTTVHLSKG